MNSTHTMQSKISPEILLSKIYWLMASSSWSRKPPAIYRPDVIFADITEAMSQLLLTKGLTGETFKLTPPLWHDFYFSI